MTNRAATPDCRKLGEARLEVAKVAKTQADWKRLWKKPSNAWAIKWGTCWKACIEYVVADFAAEVGFFVDVLGFPTNAFSADYVMFTSPDKDFFFAIVRSKEGAVPTPKESIRIQFMVENIYETALEFEKRGVDFEKKPHAYQGSPIYSATFRTPNGIPVDIWGMVDPKTTIKRRVDSAPPRVKVKLGAK